MQISIANIIRGTLIGNTASVLTRYISRVVSGSGIIEKPQCVESALNSQPILQQASMLLVPSGYKGGTLYSEIPTNGNGDLTWTRGSDAFRTNADGLIQRVPWNLVQYSEQFENASWTKTTTTITANSTTAPDGNTTADKLIVNNGASIAGSYLQQAITKSASSTTYSYTCYAKQSELNAIRVYVRDSISAANFAQVYYNINDGSVITAATSGGTFSSASSTITSVANGFYRVNLTFTSSSDTQLQLRIYPYDTVKTTGNGTDGIFIWGAQLVEGTTAQTYFPTTDRLNVPRLSYMYGSCPAALLEPQRTNSIRNSTMQGASTSPSTLPTNWVRQNTSGLTQSVVGVGTENGVNYIDINLSGTATGANDAYSFDQTISASIGQTWTNSWYFKLVSSTPNAVRLAIQEFNGSSFLNVVTQDITPTTSLARYVQTKTLVGTGVTNVRAMIYVNFVVGQTYNTTIRIAQPQMELGAYVTTPIFTSGATATRVADSSRTTGRSSLIGQSEGTMFIDLYYLPLINKGRAIAITETSTPLNNRLIININNANNRVSVISRQNSTTTSGSMSESAATVISSGRNKIALGYKSGDSVLYINGVQVATNTDSFTFGATLNDIFLMTSEISLVADNVGFVNSSALFSTRLTNAQLTSLTTL